MVRVPLALGCLVGCADPGAPRIDAIAPDAAPVGALITIEGANFCPVPGCDPLPAGSVSFGIEPEVGGAIETWTEDRIRAWVPAAARGAVLVVVTVDGRSSNGVEFEVE